MRLRPSRLGLAVAALAATAGAVLLTLPPAAREPARLVAAEPAAGARLAAPPAEVRLTFPSPPDPSQSHLLVVGPGGTPAGRGELRVAGDAAVQPVDLAGEGAVAVAYHVRLRDGREVSGQHWFQVGSGAVAPPPPVDYRGTLPATGHGHGGLVATVLAMVVLAGGLGLLIVAVRRPRPAGTSPRPDRGGGSG